VFAQALALFSPTLLVRQVAPLVIPCRTAPVAGPNRACNTADNRPGARSATATDDPAKYCPAERATEQPGLCWWCGNRKAHAQGKR
jgi:hypothetical protein